MRRRGFLGGLAAAPAALQSASARGATGADADALALDLRLTPYSRAGSYLTLSQAGGDLPLRLATVRKTAISVRGQTGAGSAPGTTTPA